MMNRKTFMSSIISIFLGLFTSKSLAKQDLEFWGDMILNIEYKPNIHSICIKSSYIEQPIIKRALETLMAYRGSPLKSNEYIYFMTSEDYYKLINR